VHRQLEFRWDPAKARKNLRKHGVSFPEAESVFYDDRARLVDDPDHSDTEDRFILLGLSRALRVLIVVHAYREADAVIRIISARRATPQERATYDAHGTRS
jgi:uncharacterized protein